MSTVCVVVGKVAVETVDVTVVATLVVYVANMVWVVVGTVAVLTVEVIVVTTFVV